LILFKSTEMQAAPMAHEIKAADKVCDLVMSEFRATLWQADIKGVETPLILNEAEIADLTASIKSYCRSAVGADHDVLVDATAAEAITAYWAARSISWVDRAIERGNALAIAGYLREHSVDPAVMRILASMIERRHHGWLLKYTGKDPLSIEMLEPVELADLLDPEKGRPTLRFARARRGNPGKEDSDALAEEIRFRLFLARSKEPKLNAAAALVAEQMKMGRSTILRWLARLSKPKNR
jgi:hypothetical protein